MPWQITWFTEVQDHLQDLGRKAAGDAHLLDFLGRLDMYTHILCGLMGLSGSMAVGVQQGRQVPDK